MVTLMPEVNVNKRVAFRLDRLLNKSHSGLVRSAPAFFDVAFHTRTNNVLPARTAAEAARNNVVQRQFTCGIALAAVLALVAVPGKNIATIELYVITRQTVIKQQTDNARSRNMKADRRYPVMPVGFETAPHAANLAPTVEVIVRIFSPL